MLLMEICKRAARCPRATPVWASDRTDSRHSPAFARPVALVLLCLAGCTAQAPSPPPALQAEPVSQLRIPFTVPLSLLQQRLEALVPRVISNAAHPMPVAQTPLGQFAIRYQLRRDPLTFYAHGDQVAVGLHGYYRVALVRRTSNGWNPVGGCGIQEPERQFVADLATTLQWRPDWRIGTTTRRQGLVLLKTCDLSLVGLKVDVTGMLRFMLAQMLDQASRQADSQLARNLDFYPAIARLWQQLNQAQPLLPGAELEAQPQGIAPFRLHATGNALETGVQVQARPICTIGQAPTPPPRPLPAAQAIDPSDLHSQVYLLTQGRYDAINQLLNAPAPGLTRQRLQWGPWSTQIESVRLAQSEGRPVLTVTLQGLGRIGLSAVPVWNAQTQQLELQDLQYRLATQRAWLQAANQVFYPVLRYVLAHALMDRLNARLGAMKTTLAQNLDRQVAPGVRLESSGLRISALAYRMQKTDAEALMGVTLLIRSALAPGGTGAR
jgi:hypothetical protein